MDCDICIIGSGPAAHTAAIYAARACLNTVVYEGSTNYEIIPGGQLTMTTDVENFPGFPDGILGYDLCQRFREQSTKAGARIITELATRVEPPSAPGEPFTIVAEGGRGIQARAVIVATGARARRLEFPGSADYWNHGISACAVCDGAAPPFRRRPLAVIGGGDSAMEEALFLTRYASRVYIIHRRDTFRASRIMQERVLAHPDITVLWNTEVREARGDGRRLQSLLLSTGEELTVAGLFFAIGHDPASAIVRDIVATDADGYICVTPGTTQTTLPGLFAAGDVQDRQWKQAITAAASGCMAALEAARWLEEGVALRRTGA